MRIAFQYKLLPDANQRKNIESWLDMLRYQYNYLLKDRFDWWELNRNNYLIPSGEFCLISCSITPPSLRDKPDYYSQKKTLPTLKKDRPWYKEIYSQVLQEMVKRVDLAFDRFIKGDSNGKHSGRPRFKKRNRYRTFTYTQLKNDCVVGNKVNLPKLGLIKFIKHRPIPSGFNIKTGLVTKKADGYYITFTLEDKTIPDFIPDILPTEENSIGIDLGLEKLLVDSTGEQVLPEKHFRKVEEKLAKLQKKFILRKRGSKAKKLIARKIAKLHLTIAKQRKQWHYETAYKVLSKADVIFIEDLKVSNMRRKNKPKKDDEGNYVANGQAAKSGMNKSFTDVALYQFTEILQQVATKLGKLIIKVNPKGTSQHCHNCLNRVPKTLGDRWHSCDSCGESMDRDENSALLIKKVGLGIASLKNARKK
jgi:putative transposase